MLKKIIICVVSFAVFFTLLPCSVGTAEGVAPIDTGKVRTAVVGEAGSGKVVFEFQSDEKMPLAGLSKLPALLAVSEAFDEGTIAEDSILTVNAKAASIRGTTAFLCEGETASAADLMMAAVMINAGDAVHTLAVGAFGSERVAVDKINSRLRQLEINAEIEDVCAEGLKLSADDLMKIGVELAKSKAYRKYSTLYYEKFEHSTGAAATELANPNKLVRQYSGCFGIATGSSNEAGYCGVFAAERGGTEFVAVVLGAANSADRFTSGIELLDYGFAAFRSVRIIKKGDSVTSVAVIGGTCRDLKLVAGADIVLLLPVNKAKYNQSIETPASVEAPIAEGDTIGRVIYSDTDGTVLAEAVLVAERGVERLSFVDSIKDILRHWLRFV